MTSPITYFAFFAVNSLVLLFTQRFFPGRVVLGTFSIDPNWAIIHSMGTLALINLFIIPFFRWYEKSSQRKLQNQEWLVGFTGVNFVSLWGITRLSIQLGLGISSWSVTFCLALAMSALQVLVTKQVEKNKKSFPVE